MIDITKPLTVSELSTDQRLELIGVIWDSIADDPGVLEPSEAQKRELDRRWEAYRADPERGESWAEVRKRILESSDSQWLR